MSIASTSRLAPNPLSGLAKRSTAIALGALVALSSTSWGTTSEADTIDTSSLTTGTAGGNQAINNYQPSLGLHYIIRTHSTFDSLGQIALFAGTFAPRGWTLANGQTLPISSFQSLYAKIGTTYGGDGESTFKLPDLRGRTAIGYGNDLALGTQSGTPSFHLTENQMPAHSHTVANDDEPTGTTGGNQAINNQMPTLAVNYQVQSQGTFPSRSVAGLDAIGMIKMYAGTGNNPSGQISANGQTLTINSNTALFSLYGTIYGGDGRTTYQTPDFTGKVITGTQQGPGLTDRQLGHTFGNDLVSLDANHLPAHQHSLPDSDLLPQDISETELAGLQDPIDVPNVQDSTANQYIIALQGIYPSPDSGSSYETGEPMLGEIRLFGANFVPSNWALADGRLLPIAQNAALFSILGTTYGGDGETNFALPDLRGRAPIGAGSGIGLPQVELGETIGNETYTLTAAHLPTHDHSIIPEPALITPAIFAGGLLIRRRRDQVA